MALIINKYINFSIKMQNKTIYDNEKFILNIKNIFWTNDVWNEFLA